MLSRYIKGTMWRKAIVVGMVTLLFLAPCVVCAQQAGPDYIGMVDEALADMKEATTINRDFGRVEIFTNVDETIPPYGPENLVKLVDLVDEAFTGWNPTVEKPLRIYVLDYETYREFGDRFNEIYARVWRQNQPPVEATLGFFIPLATGEYAYVVYGWTWFVHLHELFHIALTSHVSMLTGTNHGAVDPEVNSAWQSAEVIALVDAATKGMPR
jgi:hypothetical protein